MLKIMKKIVKPVANITVEPVKLAVEASKKSTVQVSDEVKNKRIEGLQRAREAKQVLIASGVEVKKKNPMEVWEEDKFSLRKAVNANCYDCCGRDNYVNEIRFCIVFHCPIWPVRPFGKNITQEKCQKWADDQSAKVSPMTEEGD
jgi:hypothetical protein